MRAVGEKGVWGREGRQNVTFIPLKVQLLLVLS